MTEIPKYNYQISNKSQFNKILNSKFFVMDLFWIFGFLKFVIYLSFVWWYLVIIYKTMFYINLSFRCVCKEKSFHFKQEIYFLRSWNKFRMTVKKTMLIKKVMPNSFRHLSCHLQIMPNNFGWTLATTDILIFRNRLILYNSKQIYSSEIFFI